MSSISNRFYITALEDGTTIHGNLVSTKSLTQAWNGTSAVPDWTEATEQPVIYLTLFSGSQLIQPTEDFRWYYNDVAISDTDSRFEMRAMSVTIGSTTLQMPALVICGNLASSDNTDVDIIRFDGFVDIGGSGVSFSASTQVRISVIKPGSNFGVINFVGGINNITEPNQIITMYGALYDSNGNPTPGVTTQWYFNESSTATAGAPITVDGKQYTNAYQVFEDETQDPDRYVLDHAVVKCVFKVGNDTKYTAFAFIDDMQDPEFLYIQYNGANGNAASLRKSDGNAVFTMWVGTRDDNTPIGGTQNPTFNKISIKLLDGDGDTIMTSGLATGIPNPDAEGWRDLSNTMADGKATVSIHYDTVNGVGKKNLTSIVKAEHVDTN